MLHTDVPRLKVCPGAKDPLPTLVQFTMSSFVSSVKKVLFLFSKKLGWDFDGHFDTTVIAIAGRERSGAQN